MILCNLKTDDIQLIIGACFHVSVNFPITVTVKNWMKQPRKVQKYLRPRVTGLVKMCVFPLTDMLLPTSGQLAEKKLSYFISFTNRNI